MADPITFVLDISHHQDLSLNLAQTRRDGCEGAFLKAGEGSTYVDPTFAANLAEARAAGQLVAAYWYQRSNATAAAHVAKIQATVPRDVPVIIDVEANSGNVALTRDVIGRLNAAGYRTPLLYLPRWYWQQIGSPSLAGLPPLWSSRYPDNNVGLLAAEWARVPASYWDGYGGLPVALLQFTSSASIAGHQPLDASAFRGTRDQLAALLNQEDNDMQLTDMVYTPDERQIKYGDMLAENYARIYNIEQFGAKLDALTAAVAALSTDPNLTKDAVTQIIRDAVRDNIQITGTVQIDGAVP
jgi:GH25 family lysozyme M1 (1,4-beta-N-acetylmuramidase)